MKILKILMWGLTVSVLLAGNSEPPGKAFWRDINGTIHQNNKVSLSAVKSFGIGEDPTKMQVHKMRVKIVQRWGCLRLSESSFTPDMVKKLDVRSALISFGDITGRGLSFEYSNDNNNSFNALGVKTCKLLHNAESWTVEQKINGSWVTVNKARFFFVD